LKVQNMAKPFMGSFGFSTKIPDIKFYNFLSIGGGVSSHIFAADIIEL